MANSTIPNLLLSILTTGYFTPVALTSPIVAQKSTLNDISKLLDSSFFAVNVNDPTYTDPQGLTYGRNHFLKGNFSVNSGDLKVRGTARLSGLNAGDYTTNIIIRPETFSTVLGGDLNLNSGIASVICGGSRNQIKSTHSYSCIGGGFTNRVLAGDGVIAGGISNTMSSTDGFIGGGYLNSIEGSSDRSVVCGGVLNTVTSSSTDVFIGGGANNTGTANYSVIGGGNSNKVRTLDGSILGGNSNDCGGARSCIVGGLTNKSNLPLSFIGGGNSNLITGTVADGDTESSIVGGESNSISGAISSFIGGGYSNIITNDFSAIPGGYGNRSSGLYSFVGGGNFNLASGNNSCVLGTSSEANHIGAFVLSDSRLTAKRSFDADTISFYFRNGAYFSGTDIRTSGANIYVNGDVINSNPQAPDVTWKGPGTIFSDMVTSGCAAGGADTLFRTVIIKGNTLKSNGDRLKVKLAGNTTATSAYTISFQGLPAQIIPYSIGDMGGPFGWNANMDIIRSGVSTIRYNYQQEGNVAGTNYSKSSFTGITLNTDQVLRISGKVIGGGLLADAITLDSLSIEYWPI